METLEIWAAREGAKGIMKAAGKFLQRLESLKKLKMNELEYAAWSLFGEAVKEDAETIVRLADDEMGRADADEAERQAKEDERFEKRVKDEMARVKKGGRPLDLTDGHRAPGER